MSQLGLRFFAFGKHQGGFSAPSTCVALWTAFCSHFHKANCFLVLAALNVCVLRLLLHVFFLPAPGDLVPANFWHILWKVGAGEAAHGPFCPMVPPGRKPLWIQKWSLPLGTPFWSEEGPCLSWLISPEGSTRPVIWNLSDSSAIELQPALGHVVTLVSLGPPWKDSVGRVGTRCELQT